MESPALSVGVIATVFFAFPLFVVTPVLAFAIRRMERRGTAERLKEDQMPTHQFLASPKFVCSAGLAFLAFGILALTRAILFHELIGVQFMPIGFGAVICLGVAVGLKK